MPEIREQLAQMLAAAPTDADQSVVMQELMAPGLGDAPPVKLLSYRPSTSSTTLPAIVHIHGGGYVLGSAAMADSENRRLVMELGCAILSVEYRLAPETPYPGAVEDCYAAMKWVHKNAAAMKIDPNRIGVKGESAGGGLSAALALLVRDRGEIALAFQHLIYPMIDDRTEVASAGQTSSFVGEFVWTRAQNQFSWKALLGDLAGGSNVPMYAAAARASDLRGLPATFISVGALDLFLNENIDYGRRLASAGVPIEMHVYPGAFHGFDSAPRRSRIAQAAALNSREALRKSLFG